MMIQPISNYECEIVFVRHGNTFYNKGIWNNNQGNWNIPDDAPLNDQGQQEALKLKDSLANESFSAVYASPTHRSIGTAQVIINENHPIDLDNQPGQIGSIKIDKDLEEIMMGFENTQRVITEKKYIEFFKEKTNYPKEMPSEEWRTLEGKEPTSSDILCRSWKIISSEDGTIQPETYEEYGAKLRGALFKIAANHLGEKILIVGHSTAGKVIKAASKNKIDSWSINEEMMPIGSSIKFRINSNEKTIFIP